MNNNVAEVGQARCCLTKLVCDMVPVWFSRTPSGLKCCCACACLCVSVCVCLSLEGGRVGPVILPMVGGRHRHWPTRMHRASPWLQQAAGYIAQWLERLTADQQVPGSNPGVPFPCSDSATTAAMKVLPLPASSRSRVPRAPMLSNPMLP